MKRKLTLLLGFVFLGVAVFFGVKAFLDLYSPTNVQTEQYGPAPVVLETADPDNPVTGQVPAAAGLPEEGEQVLSVDFDALQALNPDIYAWLEIPGTDISYPVVQNPYNDSYYLRTNSDGNYSAGGAIFSESTYNGTDFTDPVTILYGHHMNAGNLMFGHLQDYYSDPEFLASDVHIRIYTRAGMQEYAVFAAIPFNRSHILYYNDMHNSYAFSEFFDSVMGIRELGAYVNEDHAPSDPETDRVLILSTCLAGDNTRRFLVMATLVQ